MLGLIFFCLFSAINIHFGKTQTCNTFNNVNMQVLQTNGDTINRQVTSGCINLKNFPANTAVSFQIKDQSVKKLYKGSVTDMKHLRVISIINSDTEDIRPFAFSNVPYLKNVEISKCKLKKIEKDIFTYALTPSLETLNLAHNEINDIEDAAFYYLLGLKKLNLSHNRLGFWRSEWFDNTNSLETIDFRYNKLREIPTKAFTKLFQLRKVYLEFNDIKKIQSDVFGDMEDLEYLGLANNKLTTLDSQSFPKKLSINTLTLKANYFNYLPAELLKKITVGKIAIDYNPWACKCLDDIYVWLSEKGVKTILADVCKGNSGIPVCAVPQKSPRVCEEVVDDELTERYIEILRKSSKPLDPTCANLD